MRDKTLPKVVAFLEISEGAVREISRFDAMDVCYSASGELVVSLPADVVEGKPVRWIKGSIAAAIGMSRHRQRLFLHEALLGDDYTFTCVYGPLVVQLVILPFVTHDPVVVSDLNVAAAANNEMTVEEILHLPLDPNQDDFDGVTPLSVAAEAGAATTVCLLVEAMADTERVGQRQRTPLHRSSRRPGFCGEAVAGGICVDKDQRCIRENGVACRSVQ